jgi:hypothetical protein
MRQCKPARWRYEDFLLGGRFGSLCLQGHMASRNGFSHEPHPCFARA